MTEEKLLSNIPQGRSLTFLLFNPVNKAWTGSNFYPLTDSQVGFDYAIHRQVGRACISTGSGIAFERLCQLKIAYMRKSIPQQEHVLTAGQRMEPRWK